MVKANQAYAKGLYLEAEEYYERYLKTNPDGGDRYEAWNKLYEIAHIVRGDDEQALSALEAGLLEFGQDSRRSAAILSNMGDLYASMNNWDKAIETWQKSIANSPDQETRCTILLKLGRVYRSQWQYQLARDTFSTCIGDGTQPCDFDCTYELALTLTFMERWADARDLLQDAVKIPNVDPEDMSVAKFLLADVLIELGYIDQARKVLVSIRETYPNPKAVQAKLDDLL